MKKVAFEIDIKLTAVDKPVNGRCALLGRRIGLAAVKSFRDDFAPLIDIISVDKDLHERALDLLLQRSTETLSLVDVTSFIVMREHRIDETFAYDRDFGKEGFTLVQ